MQADAEAARHPLLAEALPHVGHLRPATEERSPARLHTPIRPASCLSASVLGGAVRAASVRGEREIPASDLFPGHFTTALQSDELVVETSWPSPGTVQAMGSAS